MTFNVIKRQLLSRRMVWTIALYKLKNENEIFELDKYEPFKFLGEVGIRRSADYQATTADPFLYSHNDRLYLFYEVQTDFGVGEIWAQSMGANNMWINHGQVLKEVFHLSYPQVFFHEGNILMIPESAQSGKVWLYAAENFPFGWKKVKMLIDEPLRDTSIIVRSGEIFLLGTSHSYELKLYFSPNIMQEFTLTSKIITIDKSIARNAGKPFEINHVLYRIAQDCKHGYGQKVGLLKIDELSIGNYSESTAVIDLFRFKPKWMASGYHHVSMSKFGDDYYVAVDGMRRDKYLNTLLLMYFKLFNYGIKK